VDVAFGVQTCGYIDDSGGGVDQSIPAIPLAKNAGGIWDSDPALHAFADLEGKPYMYRIKVETETMAPATPDLFIPPWIILGARCSALATTRLSNSGPSRPSSSWSLPAWQTPLLPMDIPLRQVQHCPTETGRKSLTVMPITTVVPMWEILERVIPLKPRQYPGPHTG
jgi:hypothetical protein